MQTLRAAAVSCALLGLTLGGCGKGPPKRELPPLVPVSGNVTLDGKPLPAATVTFIVIGGKGGNYYGITDDNGHYELMVNEKNKGAAVGDFKVIVNKWVMRDGKDAPKDVSPLESGAVEKLPPKYSQEGETQLKATVPSGGSSTLDFKVTSK